MAISYAGEGEYTGGKLRTSKIRIRLQLTEQKTITRSGCQIKKPVRYHVVTVPKSIQGGSCKD